MAWNLNGIGLCAGSMERTGTIILHDLRKAVLILLIAPFVLLQGVAPGTMMQTTPDGAEIVLCQGDKIVAIQLDSKGNAPPVQTPVHSDAAPPCGWSAVSVFAVLDVQASKQPVVLAADVRFHGVSHTAAPGPVTVSRAARGPPVGFRT